MHRERKRERERDYTFFITRLWSFHCALSTHPLTEQCLISHERLQEASSLIFDLALNPELLNWRDWSQFCQQNDDGIPGRPGPGGF